MAVILPPLPSTIPPHKRRRRTATSVLAGDFDPRPARDVLTSLLNGVPRYSAVESTDDMKRERRRDKKARESVKKRAKSAQDEPVNGESGAHHRDTIPSIADTTLHPKDFLFDPTTSSAWGSRPVLRLATTQRSVSVTPPPMPSSPPTTPGPSISSSTSRTSSKRPYTPGDDSDLDGSLADATPRARHRKKRPAARKGWKGWVEGSPPPSEKLIKLDDVQVLEERRTRSGKSFDAIGLGKDSWV